MNVFNFSIINNFKTSPTSIKLKINYLNIIILFIIKRKNNVPKFVLPINFDLADDLIVEGLATSNLVSRKYVPTSSKRTCENTTNGASSGRLHSDAQVSKQDHQRIVYSESRWDSCTLWFSLFSCLLYTSPSPRD